MVIVFMYMFFDLRIGEKKKVMKFVCEEMNVVGE